MPPGSGPAAPPSTSSPTASGAPSTSPARRPGDRDVRIAGGDATILEHLNAGLVDEFSVALSPVLLGAGTRLFDGVDASGVALEPVRSEASSRVTHLTYTVHPR